ncbi:MAG: hypothetical protein KA138_11600 [Saprospiraceae bacterium]|nr:hypothetical protein [Saprospiraceae bacterium]
MKNLDNNELIEQYLRGVLPPEDLQAVETSLATDPVFRAEVELHRQLHEEFADPKKLELRDLLTDILKESPPSQSTNYGWLKWPGIALAVLFLGWVGWHWLTPALENTQPAVEEQIKSVPPANEPIATPEIRDPQTEPLEKAPIRPIAKADPAAYLPNRDFENRLGSLIRSSNGTAEMTSPAMGATFKAENGVVKINFRGAAPADGDTAQFPLVLKIFDNAVDLNKSLFQVLPTIKNRNTADGSWAFSSAQRLRLQPGLYYYTMERQADEDLIFVGKFRVE